MVITHFSARFFDFSSKIMNILANLVFKFMARLPAVHFHHIYLKSDHDGISPYADTKITVVLFQGVLQLLLAIIGYYNGIHDHSYLTRSAILLPHRAPCHHLMDNGDLSSFLLMTGLTRDAFNTLLDIIKPPDHPALPK